MIPEAGIHCPSVRSNLTMKLKRQLANGDFNFNSIYSVILIASHSFLYKIFQFTVIIERNS